MIFLLSLDCDEESSFGPSHPGFRNLHTTTTVSAGLMSGKERRSRWGHSSKLDVFRAVYFLLETGWVLEDFKGYSIIYFPDGSRELNQNEPSACAVCVQYNYTNRLKGSYSYKTSSSSFQPADPLLNEFLATTLPTITVYAPSSHINGEQIRVGKLFGGHRKPERRSRPRMPLSSW